MATSKNVRVGIDAEITVKDSNTIVYKFLISVFLPAVLLSAFVVFTISYYSIKAHEKTYLERFETSWHAMSHSLGSSVWSYDSTAISAAIESYARLWDVPGIQVLDQYGTVLATVGVTHSSTDTARVLPMYAEGTRIIGEIRLWPPVNNVHREGFLPAILRTALLVAVLMLCLLFLMYRSIKRYILSPLKQASILLQCEELDTLDSVELPDMPDEMRAIANSILQQVCQTKTSERKLRSDLNYEMSLADSFQSLLSESHQTCVVLGGDGKVLIQNISAPFSYRQLPVLVDIVSNAVDPVVGLTDVGFQVHRVFSGLENNIVGCYEIVAENGETLIVKLLRLQSSSMALVAYNVSHAKWSDLLIDELLGLSKSGLAIFDKTGRLQMEIGESVSRLLPSYTSKIEINLARILLEFPKIGANSDSSSVSFEHRLSDEVIYRVHFSQHEQSGIGITHHDISEERKVEKHLIESQRLNDLGRITSGVAHDFNNSLGIVIGQLELASDSTALSKKTRHIETALSAANQSVNVVKQLMTYSRKQPQDPAVVALDDVIHTQKDVFQSAVGGGVTLHYDLVFDGIVCLDVELFISALLNLLINASDAMEGRGSVFVTTSREISTEGKRPMMVLSVQDTGSGIADDIINEIFLPFFTTKKNNAGNGLGLSMVQGFVDQLSGYIRIENNDIGACFHLYLPEYQDSSSGVIDHPESPGIQKLEVQTNLSDGILVMVDDNELLLDTNVQLLRAHDVHVVGFFDCIEAISFIAKSEDVACVMVDMKMPQMSGLEFVDRINAYIDNSNIILYSGNFDKHDIELAGQRGIRSILRKPLTSTQTLEAVRKCIAKKPSHARHHEKATTPKHLN